MLLLNKKISQSLISLLIVLFSQASFSQKSLPEFSFIDLNSKPVTKAILEQGKAVIVFFFDPYCDHCAQQTIWINEAIEKFQEITQIWVTTEPELDATKAFRDKNFKNTGNGNQAIFCIDTEFMFDGYFQGYYEVPSILVYNKNWKRTHIFSEETPVEEILFWVKK